MKKKGISRAAEVCLPDRLLYPVAASVLGLYARLKLNYRVVENNIGDITGPVVVLANHLSVNDWFFVALAMRPRRLNVVITRYFYSNPRLNYWLRRMGTIPKNQFSPDIGTIRGIMAAAKLGGNVMLFPEGRTSPAGLYESSERSTIKLLRKLKLPVVCVRMDGGYLTRPKWTSTDRRGRVEARVNTLFTPEQLETLSEDELFSLMAEALRSDEYSWQREKRVRFAGRRNFAVGLEGVLYKCPACGADHATRTKNDRIFCEKCGFGARLDNYYDLTAIGDGEKLPADIGAWHEWQKTVERQAIDADPDYSYTFGCTLGRPYRKKGEWLTIVGEGQVTLSRAGFLFEGVQDGEPFTMHLPIASLIALPFGPNKTVELYHENEFFSFTPYNGQACAQISIIAEQLHYAVCGERKE